MIVKLSNNTRLKSNRGHTPLEISKLKSNLTSQTHKKIGRNDVMPLWKWEKVQEMLWKIIIKRILSVIALVFLFGIINKSQIKIGGKMSENIYSQRKMRNESLKKNDFLEFLKKEAVLIIALLLAVISCFIARPKLSYIDFKVLILLFNLMIVVEAFKELKILDSIAIGLLKKCSSYKAISTALVFITFLAAMVVTNDVALLTFVPLTIVIARKANIDVLKIVIFQTLGANLGSSFTPMGNPQNLFIYSYFKLNPLDFFIITGPVLLLSVLFLLFLISRDKKANLSIELEDVKVGNKNHICIFSALFLIILLSVFHLVDYKLTLIITI